ncbi:hypothetical protein ABIA69_001933 [Lysinibacillus parviboronicapiens]|uniref:Uncharacterized protein n=1 Tax=Lysinibacillus parviboronicapiens TaxID=436516 RepID=A0ABV2PIL2_9BACI
MTKFNVGDKVVPINKTVEGYDNLRDSKNWNKAQKVNQPFLYVQYFDDSVNAYVCNVNEGPCEGCYFNESDLIPYKKVTKNQRITALENELSETKNEVAELKLIIHELRERPQLTTVINNAPQEPSTTNTVEDIIKFEGKQYCKVDREAKSGDVVIFHKNNTRFFTNGEPYKVAANGCPFDNEKEAVLPLYSTVYGRTPETVDVYEIVKIEPLTPNQQRARIIEDAKKFIEDLTANKSTDGYMLHDNLQLIPYFTTSLEERTVTVVIKGAFSKAIKYRGIAKCNSNDVFNEHIGKSIALGRALGLDVSEFEQAVQPSEVVKGHKVQWKTTDSIYDIVEVTDKECTFNSYLLNEVIGPFTYPEIETECFIINDTNAIYEVI